MNDSMIVDRSDDVSHVCALRWLAFILAIAAVLRAVGLMHQLPVPADPDYLGLIGVALRMGTGDLNPHMFTWPAAPFYFMAGCYGAMFAVCRALGVVSGAGEFQRWFFDDPSVFFLVARLIMVTVGLMSVALIYRVGCLLGTRRIGLWASALLAVTPAEVILCHYQKAEPLLVLATLLALAALVRWWQEDSAGRAALAGAAIGLACAIKYNSASLIAPAAATWIYHAYLVGGDKWKALLLKRFILGGLCFIGTFLVLNPYLILDFREALHQIAGQKHLLETPDSPIHETPARSYLTIMLPVSFGWVLYAIYGAGLLWLTVSALRRRGVEIVLLVFALVSIAAMMVTKVVTPYYPLPMVPALAVGAAALCCEIGRRARPAKWVLGLLLTAPAGLSLVLDYRLAFPGPTFLAEYWIAENVPPGCRVAHRHWLPPLLPAHKLRLGCYHWPPESRVSRDGIDAVIRQGATWFVLNPRDVAGREEELFGPPQAPLAREVRRFTAPHTYLPLAAEGVAIWKVCRPSAAPPLAQVLSDADGARPIRRLDVTFARGITLLGVDPIEKVGREPFPENAPVPFSLRPGQTVELCTYWRVSPEAPKRVFITGELRGSGGFLADLTQELAYGIDAFLGRRGDRGCTVVHRMLIRPGARAKPGDYTINVGLRDPESGADLPIVAGATPGSQYATVDRIAVVR